ncbi:MAG: hypothetical protein MJE68_02040 [Proteobacteria bacterium]|nr:hypothetical protein [Pseudomonadota bacterium]
MTPTVFQHEAAIEFVLATNTPAWIFAGNEGIGKATAALHITARLLADDGEADEVDLFLPKTEEAKPVATADEEAEEAGEAKTEKEKSEAEGDSQDSLFAMPDADAETKPAAPLYTKPEVKQASPALIAKLARNDRTPLPTADADAEADESELSESESATDTPAPPSPDATPPTNVSLSQLEVHPDAMIIRPQTNQQANATGGTARISIDQIRAMSAFLTKTSAKGGWRVVVVDALDDMTLNAANGMLKMLEEPPAKTTIILISHTPGAILPTIRSRCRLHRFHRLSDEDCCAVIAHLYPDIDATHAETMLAFADGSPGRAVLMVETKSVELYADTCQALAHDPPDTQHLDQLASSWGAAGINHRKRRRLGVLFFDRLLTMAAKGEAGRSAEETAALASLKAKHSPQYLAQRHSQMLFDLRQADHLNTASQPLILRLLLDLTTPSL